MVNRLLRLIVKHRYLHFTNCTFNDKAIQSLSVRGFLFCFFLSLTMFIDPSISQLLTIHCSIIAYHLGIGYEYIHFPWMCFLRIDAISGDLFYSNHESSSILSAAP